MENGKIIGLKDCYDVEGTYGERQGRSRYIIEKEFNDTEASCHSIKEGIRWIQELLDEYRSSFDLAYLKGTVQHIRVLVVEDEDGDTEEDWNDDDDDDDSDEE